MNWLDGCTSVEDVSRVVIEQIRPKVLAKLETMRDQKLIGKSLDAEVLLYVSDSDACTLVLCGWKPPQLSEVFGVSRTWLMFGAGDAKVEVSPSTNSGITCQ